MCVEGDPVQFIVPDIQATHFNRDVKKLFLCILHKQESGQSYLGVRLYGSLVVLEEVRAVLLDELIDRNVETRAWQAAGRERIVPRAMGKKLQRRKVSPGPLLWTKFFHREERAAARVLHKVLIAARKA